MDLPQLLLDNSVEYHPGDRAWNICCPFCVGRSSGQPDTKFRCGIFKDLKGFYCFRCSKAGTLYELLSELLGISHKEYKDLTDEKMPVNKTVSELVRDKMSLSVCEKQRSVIELPGVRIKNSVIDFFHELRVFLIRRRIEVATCVKHKARYDYLAKRIVLPIYDGDTLISYQARDVTDRDKRKYDNPHGVKLHDYLYLTEKTCDVCYLVEGIFDAWRINTDSASLFGKELHPKQKIVLKNSGYTEVRVALDSEVYLKSLKIAQEIAPLFQSVGIVRLPDGKDPDNLTEDTIKKELQVTYV